MEWIGEEPGGQLNQESRLRGLAGDRTELPQRGSCKLVLAVVAFPNAQECAWEGLGRCAQGSQKKGCFRRWKSPPGGVLGPGS